MPISDMVKCVTRGSLRPDERTRLGRASWVIGASSEPVCVPREQRSAGTCPKSNWPAPNGDSDGYRIFTTDSKRHSGFVPHFVFSPGAFSPFRGVVALRSLHR